MAHLIIIILLYIYSGLYRNFIVRWIYNKKSICDWILRKFETLQISFWYPHFPFFTPPSSSFDTKCTVLIPLHSISKRVVWNLKSFLGSFAGGSYKLYLKGKREADASNLIGSFSKYQPPPLRHHHPLGGCCSIGAKVK